MYTKILLVTKIYIKNLLIFYYNYFYCRKKKDCFKLFHLSYSLKWEDGKIKLGTRTRFESCNNS